MPDPVSGHQEQKPLTSIRGIAALWVVGSHLAGPLQPMLPAWLYTALHVGYMAVDVFFVLSGFILALVYRHLIVAQIPMFFAKRLARVYPLNIVLTTVMAAFAAAGIPPGIWQHWRTLPWFYTMMEAFIPEPVMAWILTSWSVGIEVLCYLSFPVLLLAFRRLPLVPLLAVVGVAVAAEYWVQTRYLAMFFSVGALIRGMGGFGLGVALGLLAPRLRRPSAVLVSVGEVLCVAAFGVAVAWDVLRFLPFAAAGLILLLYFGNGAVARGLHGRFFFWQGQISYSVYMLHGPLLADWMHYGDLFGAWVLNPFALARHMPTGAAVLCSAVPFVAVISLLATLTWRFVEQPGRRLPGLIGRRRPAAAVSALAHPALTAEKL